MVFEKIDKNSWNRKEYFDHYFASVPCTYSMTVKVDITQIKEKGMKGSFVRETYNERA